MGLDRLLHNLPARQRTHLRSSYQDWMEQVHRTNHALMLTSDEGLRWCMNNRPTWQAYRIQPYTPNQGISFNARGQVTPVAVDLVTSGQTVEILDLSTFPTELRPLLLSPQRPRTLCALLKQMERSFPILREAPYEPRILHPRTARKTPGQTPQ
jgi:hypothetical protein